MENQSPRNTAKAPEETQTQYDAIRKHTRKATVEPTKRINILLPQTVYARLLDVCIGRGCLITEYMVDRINRDWVNRSRITHQDYSGTDKEYLNKHQPKHKEEEPGEWLTLEEISKRYNMPQRTTYTKVKYNPLFTHVKSVGNNNRFLYGIGKEEKQFLEDYHLYRSQSKPRKNAKVK